MLHEVWPSGPAKPRSPAHTAPGQKFPGAGAAGEALPEVRWCGWCFPETQKKPLQPSPQVLLCSGHKGARSWSFQVTSFPSWSLASFSLPP